MSGEEALSSFAQMARSCGLHVQGPFYLLKLAHGFACQDGQLAQHLGQERFSEVLRELGVPDEGEGTVLMRVAAWARIRRLQAAARLANEAIESERPTHEDLWNLAARVLGQTPDAPGGTGSA